MTIIGLVDSTTGEHYPYNEDDFVSGTIMYYPTSEPIPDGWLRCDGAEVSQATYSALYAVVGDKYANSGNVYNNARPWRQQYDFNLENNGDITGWTTGTSLPEGLGSSQAIVTNSRVHLLGGHSNSAFAVSTVYTAPINSDGTLGTWTTGTSLPGVLRYSQAIVTNSRVYLLGGQTVNDALSTVYTAPINSDGTLGTWTTGISLPGVLRFSQAIVTNNRVHLLGGFGSWSVSTVYTAPINSDGTLGTWTTGTSLPGVLHASQAIVTNSRVYLLGGNVGSAVVSTVYEATFSGGKNDYLDSTFIDFAPEAGNFILPNLADEEHGDYTTSRRYVHPIIKT